MNNFLRKISSEKIYLKIKEVADMKLFHLKNDDNSSYAKVMFDSKDEYDDFINSLSVSVNSLYPIAEQYKPMLATIRNNFFEEEGKSCFAIAEADMSAFFDCALGSVYTNAVLVNIMRDNNIAPEEITS